MHTTSYCLVACTWRVLVTVTQEVFTAQQFSSAVRREAGRLLSQLLLVLGVKGDYVPIWGCVVVFMETRLWVQLYSVVYCIRLLHVWVWHQVHIWIGLNVSEYASKDPVVCISPILILSWTVYGHPYSECVHPTNHAVASASTPTSPRSECTAG